jgi:hypothetical protein
MPPAARLSRRFLGGGRQDKIGGALRLDLDMQVDAVEQRTRQLCLIVGGAARRDCMPAQGRQDGRTGTEFIAATSCTRAGKVTCALARATR